MMSMSRPCLSTFLLAAMGQLLSNFERHFGVDGTRRSDARYLLIPHLVSRVACISLREWAVDFPSFTFPHIRHRPHSLSLGHPFCSCEHRSRSILGSGWQLVSYLGAVYVATDASQLSQSTLLSRGRSSKSIVNSLIRVIFNSASIMAMWSFPTASLDTPCS